jgi:hypothetical protein
MGSSTRSSGPLAIFERPRSSHYNCGTGTEALARRECDHPNRRNEPICDGIQRTVWDMLSLRLHYMIEVFHGSFSF